MVPFSETWALTFFFPLNVSVLFIFIHLLNIIIFKMLKMFLMDMWWKIILSHLRFFANVTFSVNAVISSCNMQFQSPYPDTLSCILCFLRYHTLYLFLIYWFTVSVPKIGNQLQQGRKICSFLYSSLICGS